jgi:hypothetical protein
MRPYSLQREGAKGGGGESEVEVPVIWVAPKAPCHLWTSQGKRVNKPWVLGKLPTCFFNESKDAIVQITYLITRSFILSAYWCTGIISFWIWAWQRVISICVYMLHFWNADTCIFLIHWKFGIHLCIPVSEVNMTHLRKETLVVWRESYNHNFFTHLRSRREIQWPFISSIIHPTT